MSKSNKKNKDIDNNNKSNIIPVEKEIKQITKKKEYVKQRAGHQLPRKKLEQILADSSVYTSINYIASKNDVHWETVKRIQDDYANEIEEFRENKKREFADEAWQSIKKALLVSDKKLEMALNNSEKADELIDKAMDMLTNEEITKTEFKEITRALSGLNNFNIRDLSTYIGTLVDKHQLLNGEATERIDAKMSFAEIARKADEYAN